MSTDATASKQIGILLPCASAGFLIFFLLQPSILMVAGTLILAGLLALVLRWPETGTLVVLFLLYSNIGVLAMRPPTTANGSGGPRTMAALVAMLLILAASLIYQVLVRKERLLFDRGLVWMLVFLAVALASSFFARDGQIIVTSAIDYLIQGLVLFFLLTNVIRDFAILRRATWALLLAGSLMAGLSIFQTVTHTEKKTYGGLAQIDSGPPYGREDKETLKRQQASGKIGSGGTVLGQARAAGPVGAANEYGQILLVLLPLSVLKFRTEPSRAFRALALVATGLILGGLFLTFSRSCLVAAIVLFGMMACMGLLKPRQVLVSVLGAGLLITVLQPMVVSRMLTLGRVKGLFSKTHDGGPAPDSSVVLRYALNVAAWNVFVDHPILGVGPGQFVKYYSTDYVNRVGLLEERKGYQPHNLYFRILAETGLIGSACFLSIMGATMYGLWKERRRFAHSHPELAFAASGFFLCLVGFAIASIFAHLSDQRYFWLLLALSSSATRIIHCYPEKQAIDESYLR